MSKTKEVQIIYLFRVFETWLNFTACIFISPYNQVSPLTFQLGIRSMSGDVRPSVRPFGNDWQTMKLKSLLFQQQLQLQLKSAIERRWRRNSSKIRIITITATNRNRNGVSRHKPGAAVTSHSNFHLFITSHSPAGPQSKQSWGTMQTSEFEQKKSK